MSAFPIRQASCIAYAMLCYAMLGKLREFVERLRSEPLLLKAYTAQAIVSMQDRLQEEEVAVLAKAVRFSFTPIDDRFADLSKLSHSSLRHYAVEMLDALVQTGDEALVKAACSPSGNVAAAPFPPFDASKIFLQNAHAFPGMTLTVSERPMQELGKQAPSHTREVGVPTHLPHMGMPSSRAPSAHGRRPPEHLPHMGIAFPRAPSSYGHAVLPSTFLIWACRPPEHLPHTGMPSS